MLHVFQSLIFLFKLWYDCTFVFLFYTLIRNPKRKHNNLSTTYMYLSTGHTSAWIFYSHGLFINIIYITAVISSIRTDVNICQNYLQVLPGLLCSCIIFSISTLCIVVHPVKCLQIWTSGFKKNPPQSFYKKRAVQQCWNPDEPLNPLLWICTYHLNQTNITLTVQNCKFKLLLCFIHN